MTARRTLAALASAGVLVTTGVLYAAEAHPTDDTVLIELPRCEFEDGSDLIDGFCAWIDPDTGDVYINPAPAEVSHD